MLPRLGRNEKGLDYGAGPGPALSVMFENMGHEMALYDKYFYPSKLVFGKTYDFVVSTETVEHFTNPLDDFENINSLMRPGGLFGVMTSIFYDDIDFSHWYYMLDPTHISFYTPKTLLWISERWEWELSFPSRNVCLFRKQIGVDRNN